MTFANKLREIMKVDLKEDGPLSDIESWREELLHKAGKDTEKRKNKDTGADEFVMTDWAKKMRERIRAIHKQYADGVITSDELENKYEDLDAQINQKIKPAIDQEKEEHSYFAVEALTDFEGNSIPQRYRPAYLMVYGDDNYDFTPRLIPGGSIFEKSKENEILEKLKQYSEDIKVQPVYDVEPYGNEKVKPASQTALKNDEEDFKKPSQKEIKNILKTPSSIMRSATFVDTREIEAFADAGINPKIAYANNPKPGWWYVDDDGKKHMILLYGITDDDYIGEKSVAVAEVDRLQLLPNGYLKKHISPMYLMPVEKFKEIIHNPMNADTYKEILSGSPEEEWEDQNKWTQDIKQQKQIMLSNFKAWKEKNAFKYDLDKYTDNSLLNVYYANKGRHFPLDKALKFYGKTQQSVEDQKLDSMFKNWYDSNVEEYNLDRFDEETLHNIFADVAGSKMSIEDAILKNTNLDVEYEDDFTDEDDDIEEAVLTEKGNGEINDNSKDKIISDPNVLRDVVLPNLDISPVYVSNPFKVEYMPWGKSGNPDDLDVVDKRYYITGVRKPDGVGISPEKITPSNVKIIYIKDADKKGARQEAISYKELMRMLSASINDDPVPSVWERYSTYKDQKRALNKGAHYKWVQVNDKLIYKLLAAMEREPKFQDSNLIELYNKAKASHEENKFVSYAVRDFDRDASFKPYKPHNFSGYQVAMDTRTHLPTAARKHYQANVLDYLMGISPE